MYGYPIRNLSVCNWLLALLENEQGQTVITKEKSINKESTSISTGDTPIENKTYQVDSYPVTQNASLESQLRSELITFLIVQFTEIISRYKNTEKQDADLLSVSILYRSSEEPFITIVDTNGHREDFETSFIDEKEILQTLSLEYDLTIREVTRLTTFIYFQDLERNVPSEDYTLQALITGERTIITITYGVQEETYWFNTENTYNAAEQFARLFNVSTKTVWNKLLEK